MNPPRPNILLIDFQDDEEIDAQIKRKQDEFLDIYSLYQRTGLSWIKEALLQKGYELHLLDPTFTFTVPAGAPAS